MEKYVSHILETRLQKAIEEFVEKNEIRLKELSLVERVVKVEEELKALREISGKNFESLVREMNARFEAVDKRFESLQREINTRFEAMNKRFTSVQWMIGLFVGIPAFILVITRLLEVLK
jgi:hypothetical protein